MRFPILVKWHLYIDESGPAIDVSSVISWTQYKVYKVVSENCHMIRQHYCSTDSVKCMTIVMVNMVHKYYKVPTIYVQSNFCLISIHIWGSFELYMTNLNCILPDYQISNKIRFLSVDILHGMGWWWWWWWWWWWGLGCGWWWWWWGLALQQYRLHCLVLGIKYLPPVYHYTMFIIFLDIKPYWDIVT